MTDYVFTVQAPHAFTSVIDGHNLSSVVDTDEINSTIDYNTFSSSVIISDIRFGSGGGEEEVYDIEIDDTVSGVIYIGQALPGSSVSDPVWRIRKITEALDGDSSAQWAGATNEFVHAWTDRLTLAY